MRNTHSKIPAGKRVPRDGDSVQALERGMRVLALLARHGPMSASALAAELGVHQSSASRLLRALVKSGFVCKPSFQRFALDAAVLVFAGMALERFPVTAAAVTACNEIYARTGLSAAVAMLRQGRLVYLARIDQSTDASTVLVDNSDFPLHESSLGLILSHSLGRNGMLAELKASLKRAGCAGAGTEPRRLHALTARSLRSHGILYTRGFGRNRFNASICFPIGGERYALAVYSKTRVPSPARACAVLESGKARVLEVWEKRTGRNLSRGRAHAE
ncbi:MAG: helix-turn-helix domain-containing protein [Kiritimatiellae bacterium]|nr:helix-turn-helix domain-containing protein [Kiritimatiellia bacterium]